MGIVSVLLEKGGDDGDVLGKGAVAAPFQVNPQQVVAHGTHVKAHRLKRVTHKVGMAARLALGACTPFRTQAATECEAAAARRQAFSFHQN